MRRQTPASQTATQEKKQQKNEHKRHHTEYKHPMRHFVFTILCLYFGTTAIAQNTDNRSKTDAPGRYANTNTLSNDDVLPDSLGTDSLVSDSLPVMEGIPWDVQLRHDLDALATEANGQSFTTGFYVYDLTADSAIYGYNDFKVLRPASTQKIITAVSALHLLGVNYQYKTRACYTGVLQDSVLRGNIYVIGGFDPVFSESNFSDLVDAVCELGIKRIEGRVLGDISMKDSTIWGEGWCWDDAPSDVEPYLSPLMVNRGCVVVRASGNKATTEPQSSFVTMNPLGPGKFSATRNWISNGNIITTTGTGSKSISVYRPDLFFVCTLCDRLKERGITIASPDSSKPIYGTGTLPTSKTVEFFCMTRSLGQLLNKTLKDSDNLYAESMLYLIANAKAGKWATAADARHAIDAIIKQAGESPSYSRVADGSGVSLYDYTTPRTLVAMLRFAYKDQNIFSNFYPALPIAGMDGTLNSRMTQGNAFGNVRAKTGTVSGVSCLAGYVTASNGNMLAFSILCNGCLKIANAKALQNKLCQELAR